MSEYVRLVMEKPPDITRAEFNTLKTDFVYQVKKIGVNINQIAKKYNENAWIQPSNRLIDRMDELQQIVNQIANSIYDK